VGDRSSEISYFGGAMHHAFFAFDLLMDDGKDLQPFLRLI